MVKRLFPVLLVFLFAGQLFAKEPRLQDENTGNIHKLAIGGVASTNGLGANLIYSLTKKIDIRGGFEKLHFDYDFVFSEDDIDYDASLDYKTGSFSLLADYYLLRFFYVTAGFGINRFDPYIEGYASSNMEYGDIYITPEDIGNFSISFEPGLKISPYSGLGFGRNIGLNKTMAFNFELGAFYMGSPEVTIHADGLLAPTADPAHGQKELFERQLESFRFYPVLKFGISVRLF